MIETLEQLPEADRDRLRADWGADTRAVVEAALSIAATQAGNIASYIPTSLISITDGQLNLDSHLFNEGVRPAVDVGLSVSRVGGKAQPRALRRLASGTRSRAEGDNRSDTNKVRQQKDEHAS